MWPVGEGKWKARCPVPDHHDTNGSLSIRKGREAVLLHCFGGCPRGAVMFALGLKDRDLFGEPEDDVSEPRKTPTPPTPEELEDRLRGRPVARGRVELASRGVSDDMAEHFGYRLWDEPEGIALPSRHPDGLVHGIQVRTGKAGQKYRWVTPPTYHVSNRGLSPLTSGFRVTEGVIKADVATYHTELPTVAINGAASWRNFMPLVEEYRPKQVVLAFDTDWKTNGGVRRCLRDVANALLAQRVDVYIEEWPDEYKGIDDYLAAGNSPWAIERRTYNP